MQPSNPYDRQPQTPQAQPLPQQPAAYPQPLVAQQAPLESPQVSQQPASNKRRKLALWLLIGPSALFVIAMIVAFAAPALFPDQPPAPGEMFGERNPALAIANIFAFASGAIVILTWLPGIIIGSILLAKK